MIQGPKILKFKKTKKGRLTKYNFKYTNNKLVFGTLGLKTVNSGFINIKQIESARKAIVKHTNRKSKIWIKINPVLPVTSKATGVRMGKGKGQFSHWSARVRGGTIIFEVCGADMNAMILALIACSKKLPVKTKIFN